MDKDLKNNQLISVIIPCYNGEKFLSEAIESVLAQSYPNWECILINDGSNDSTEQISKKYAAADSRITYIYQKNQGPTAARNKGIAVAKGKFIQLLDQDDIIKPEKFVFQLDTFNKNSDADIAYCEYLCFNNYNKENLYPMTGRYIISENPVDDFIYKWGKELILPPHPYLFRKSCFDNWGWYDEKLFIADDWDLYVRFSIHRPKFIFTEGVFALYRRHPDSICSEKNASALFHYKIKMYKKHTDNESLSPNHRQHVEFLLHDFIGKEAFEDLRNKKILTGMKKLILASYYSRNPFYYFYHGLYWLKQGL